MLSINSKLVAIPKQNTKNKLVLRKQAASRAKVKANAAESGEVTIRRRPPGSILAQTFMGNNGPESKPHNILEEIVWYKAREVEAFREKLPLEALTKIVETMQPTLDFRGSILKNSAKTGKPGLIAEVKKASPSKGIIQPDFDPIRIAKAYEAGGASCLSVLTDEKFFQGSFDNLRLIRASGVRLPMLCKEFIVDPYQIFKARACGADAILLIASVLTTAEMQSFIQIAASLNLQCLIEVHTTGELARVLKIPLDLLRQRCLLGINSRDLQTFKVDLHTVRKIMESPEGLKVKEAQLLMTAESGIFTSADVSFVQDAGCGAILVGESIVKQGDPETGVKKLLGLI
nr:indole-3-glycerol phosphate chloroplastic-like (IGP) [Polytomella parva]